MKKIVFHHSASSFEHSSGLKLLPSHREIEKVLSIFEDPHGGYDVLNVPRGMTTGWRTSLWSDEVEVCFCGTTEEWSCEEVSQAMNRTRPSVLRTYEDEMYKKV